MSQAITFHTMLPTERSQVEDMILNLYSNDGKETNDYMSRKKIRPTLDRALTHPDSLRVEVFKEQQQIIGYALLYSFWSNEYGGMVLTLDELYVAPLFRSRGISSTYIDKLQDQKSSYVLLALEVMPGNEKAKSLYTRLGFEENRRMFMNKKV
ncbi:MAG: GNAT family N-acetyltransferase [Cytophagaceae bacterium]|nr:GNAT family N-acetyltransferase [Cytophagaceae bacterium]